MLDFVTLFWFNRVFLEIQIASNESKNRNYWLYDFG